MGSLNNKWETFGMGGGVRNDARIAREATRTPARRSSAASAAAYKGGGRGNRQPWECCQASRLTGLITRVCTHTGTHPHACTHPHTCTPTCAQTQLHPHPYPHVCTHTCTHVCAHTCTHAHAHTPSNIIVSLQKSKCRAMVLKISRTEGEI